MRAAYLVLLAFCAVLAAPMSETRDQVWKTFESKAQRFRVRYPPSWNRLADWCRKPSSDVFLDIINFPNSERVKGVVLNSSGAEIYVARAPSDTHTLERWIEREVGHDEVLDKRELTIPEPAKDGCRRLVRLLLREDVSDSGKAFFSYTEYFCSTDTGLFLIRLHHWDGDPHKDELQATAFKIALSLRSW